MCLVLSLLLYIEPAAREISFIFALLLVLAGWWLAAVFSQPESAAETIGLVDRDVVDSMVISRSSESMAGLLRKFPPRSLKFGMRWDVVKNYLTMLSVVC